MWFNKKVLLQQEIQVKEDRALLQSKLQSASQGHERLLAVLESMAEGVMVIGTDQKVLLMNSVLGQALGLNKDHVLGHDYWEVFRDSEMNHMIGQVYDQRKPFSKEHRIILSELIFQVQVSPVSRQGEFLGVIAVFHDVTRLKQLERMRTEFAANVSHELKTPLTSIMGFVETLKEGAIHDPENAVKFLNVIEEHSKKLHRLIEDLLLLSRLESEEAPIEKKETNLSKILFDILDSFEPLIKLKKITLENKFPKEPVWIHADAYLMEQALANIIGNAIKYNCEGGNLILEFFTSPGLVKMRVSDTGIGIAPGELPHIFERFYRAEKSRSRQTGGSGLGLSIVKYIVERHGGRIEVESTENKGSTFMLTLPFIKTS